MNAAHSLTDLRYEEERNKLIPEAESYANSMFGYHPTGTEEERLVWCDRWNKSFHTRMTELARERKLVS